MLFVTYLNKRMIDIMVWLEIELEQDKFYQVTKHIIGAMFIAIERWAPNLRHLVIHSIGDHLNKDTGQQDYSNAEVFIEQSISDREISKENMKNLLASETWKIRLVNKNKPTVLFSFITDKETDLIIERIPGKGYEY